MKQQPWLYPKEKALVELFELCPSLDHQSLVSEMLHQTKYVSANEYQSAIIEMGNQIEVGWDLNPQSTFFVSSNNDANTDSSQEVLNQLKSHPWQKTGWRSRQFFIQYKKVMEKISDGDCIVIVDDFVGTGNSMKKTITWFQAAIEEIDKNVELKICVVGGCGFGVAEIEKTGCEIYCVYSIDKAISEQYKDQKLNEAIQQMGDLEDILAKQIKGKYFDKYRFGYGKSEAMYFRDGGNTPNNVFPIFWWDMLKGKRRYTVMHRTAK